jgi:hypothetical protein
MHCKALVVFFSKDSVASSYVRTEVEFALNNRIIIIPVYLEGMDILPPGLALGLNSTQGITDVENPQKIIGQIRDALVYNHIARDGETADAPSPERGNVKKRAFPAFAALLGLALLLAVPAFRFFGPWPDGGQTAAPATRYSVTLAKRIFTPAEPILLSVADVSQRLMDDGAIVGVCAPDAKQGDFLSSEFLSSAFFAEGEGRVRLRAPLEPGQYEIRGYADGNVLTEETLAARLDFVVDGDALGAFSLAIDKPRYGPYEDIPVRIRGVPRAMLEDGALVGIYRAGAEPEKFLVYVLIGERDRLVTLDAPYEAGEYEVRAYANNRIFAGSTLVAKAPFTVVE